MSQRSIEEVYKSIAPPKSSGVPRTPVLNESFTASNELSSSMSQAAQEISQLRAAWQQQVEQIAANTQAIRNNTSAQSRTVASTVGHAASGIFGGALSFLSPLITGISHLFGGGNSQPVALPVYTAPPSVSIDGTLRNPVSAPAASAPGNSTTNTQTNYSPQITVNVSAMDSQSFMDRSGDIANAVREAMLNNHPINGVVADL